MIKTLIIDDEAHARATVRLLLQNEPQIEIAGEAADGFAAMEMIQEHKPDFIFLDVQMPEMNGFEMLDRLQPADLPQVLFVTAYDHYALQAFDVNAIDYLLKPFDDDRFREALKRAMEQLEQKDLRQLNQGLQTLLASLRHQGSAAGPKYPQRLAVKTGGRIFFISVDEISWIEAADQYVKLHTGKTTHLLRESMSKLEDSLSPEHFCRIHRSAIVKISNIKELRPQPTGDYQVILRDNTKLKLGRNRRQALQEKIGWPF